MTRTPIDLGLLIIRLIFGAILTAHGFQKLFLMGPGQTGAAFASMSSLPAPEIMAWIAILVELLGGLALILGVATRIAAIAAAVVMAGAMISVHLPNGFFNTDGGIEYTLMLTAVGVALAVTGAGRYSLDAALGRGGRDTTAAHV
ncbi:DoxX family protein [Corynebacterium pygosceleis]|uniref:DoxX family protein n=1 Tax=Corynebacterium pygosceleis TaxID=2800406 RepID=A0A9Q4GKB6_9CORY|nr:DoxX family protein [Corynebacterium pygosceleis]MCK7638346.1 DoxX family protein [Corynebacterium pygosceleis]MCK7675326.1 DoxX family protein [Corynebacterium pygosceleis]MCL0121280.1 DoxX family protein [Corynebacterium pygosceleis]MCX7445496.1 DoxX family protein [Corynebacterium pygosceleis]MCX7469009.1 DoxX family protein [Corynebacterium pygosceleis]